uniref:Uncharacterized protein n=1 Tax=Rhizophora mucronata TaxID=61149 RepID=A0A2P2ND00_RHIMU
MINASICIHMDKLFFYMDKLAALHRHFQRLSSLYMK